MTRNTIILGIPVTVNGDITNQELAIYLDEYQSKRKSVMTRAVVTVEGQNIAINGYDATGVPFERIRRITGYLVGTTDRWNNAKRSEERDRVKHGVGGRY
jgi:anaerobic ribonucleoside-triphosphate reductase